MAITENSVVQRGTRVKVVRGPFPSDSALLGRVGTVVDSSQYYPNKVDVSLDGDAQIRTFAPVELEVLTGSGSEALPPDVEAARKRLSRP